MEAETQYHREHKDSIQEIHVSMSKRRRLNRERDAISEEFEEELKRAKANIQVLEDTLITQVP